MLKDTRYFVGELRRAIDASESYMFFEKEMDKYKEILGLCKDLLLHCGYKVVNPKRSFDDYGLKTIDDLVYFFYNRLDHYHSESTDSYRNIKNDRVIAKRFLESRMSIGHLSKKEALLECAKIIETIFEYESEFSFEFALSFWVLGQDKCGWITAKAIDIMNSKRKRVKEDVWNRKIDEIENKYIPKNVGWEDLEEIDT